MRWVEWAFAKLGSRKFWVFVAATVGLYLGKLDSWAWVAIAVAYIGGNVAQKIGWFRRS